MCPRWPHGSDLSHKLSGIYLDVLFTALASPRVLCFELHLYIPFHAHLCCRTRGRKSSILLIGKVQNLWSVLSWPRKYMQLLYLSSAARRVALPLVQASTNVGDLLINEKVYITGVCCVKGTVFPPTDIQFGEKPRSSGEEDVRRERGLWRRRLKTWSTQRLVSTLAFVRLCLLFFVYRVILTWIATRFADQKVVFRAEADGSRNLITNNSWQSQIFFLVPQHFDS